MPAVTVIRPVVRSFALREVARAAEHVRRGGHALVWEKPNRARLVVPFFEVDDDANLGWWSILDLRKQRYRVIPSGGLRGFIDVLIPPDCNGIVRRRAERDLAHAGSTRRIRLDCLDCGACCYNNEVVLDEEDVARLRGARRERLLRPPYTRRKDGKLLLRLNAQHHCHLKRKDNRCGIYPIRPGMCREFPVASECCLSARAEEFGIWDGNDPLAE